MGSNFAARRGVGGLALPIAARRAGFLPLAILLGGCPQLLDGDFERLEIGAGGSGAGAGARNGSADAGVRGGSGGALDGPSEAGDAGPDPGGGDAATPGAGGVLGAALAHRYRFDGVGALAVDSLAEADANLIATTLDGSGSVELDGDGQYVNLPNGIFSSANDQTIEAWLTWNGGGSWQRVFDFGSNDSGEDSRGNGRRYLFLTPRNADGRLMVAYSTGGYYEETRLVGTAPLPTGVLVQVVVVIDSASDAMSLYVNGQWNAETALDQRLSELDDVNVWIGMSQYELDPSLDATLSDFRLYHRALDDDDIRLSYELGPDAAL